MSFWEVSFLDSVPNRGLLLRGEFCVQFLVLWHILKANKVNWGPLLSAEHMNMETQADFTCPSDMVFKTLLTDSSAGRFSHTAFLR